MWNIIIILNNCFLCEYVLNCNLFLWSKLYFQHHYSSLQCHMIFRNHNNMLICCSRNISDYYQCWKQLCCTIFLWKPWYILFFRIHRWIESSKEQHLFEIDIINVFTGINLMRHWCIKVLISFKKEKSDPKLLNGSVYIWSADVVYRVCSLTDVDELAGDNCINNYGQDSDWCNYKVLDSATTSY